MDLPSHAQILTPEIDFLYKRRRGKTRLGLESTRHLLRELGSPERGVPVLHVAGTNGKGSTTAMAAAILREAGLRVGHFTSPHMLSVEERIRVDGVPITTEEFRARVREMRRRIERADASFFESVTAMAALHFRDAGVDVAVYEVGLGGRLDSTTALPAEVTVLTGVGHDHESILGRGLRAVCREKLGIVRPGVTLHAALDHPALVRQARRHCDRFGSPLRLVAETAVRVLDLDLWSGMQFELGDPPRPMWTRFIGRHHARNAALACAAAAELARDRFSIVELDPVPGLAQARLPGRFQVLPATEKEPLLILDVAHNPESLQATLDVAKQLLGDARPIVILGMLRDKRLDGVVPRLDGWALGLRLTTPRVARAWKLEEIARRLRRRAPGLSIEVSEDVGAALDATRGTAPVLLLGSHYLVGEALPVLASRRRLTTQALLYGSAPEIAIRAAG
jgi:dihydrofolate synthase/folylpolyglutamate synthase